MRTAVGFHGSKNRKWFSRVPFLEKNYSLCPANLNEKGTRWRKKKKKKEEKLGGKKPCYPPHFLLLLGNTLPSNHVRFVFFVSATYPAFSSSSFNSFLPFSSLSFLTFLISSPSFICFSLAAFFLFVS